MRVVIGLLAAVALVVAVVAAATRRFDGWVGDEARALLAAAHTTDGRVVEARDVNHPALYADEPSPRQEAVR